MAIDMLNLLRARGITFYEHGEDPHAGEGWIQMDCPFCQDEAPHLGWNQEAQVFRCWHCGRHPVMYTLSLMLGLPIKAVKDLLKQYENRVLGDPFAPARKALVHATRLIYPETIGPLNRRCARYLASRGFRPIELARTWGLLCTSPEERDDWADRIVAPAHDLEGNEVSYQGRAIQPGVVPPYRACSPSQELMPIKHTLYGASLARRYSTIIVVEGIVDAWRIGPGAVATYGTGYTSEQVELICRWPRRVIMFDADALREGAALANHCSQHRGETGTVLCPTKDPGAMTPLMAAQARQAILGAPSVGYNVSGCAAGDGSA